MDDSVEHFIRGVVEKSPHGYAFLCVLTDDTPLSDHYRKKAPTDNAPPQNNLYKVYKKLNPRASIKEAGFWKIVSSVKGVQGMGTLKLGAQRSNSASICHYRNQVWTFLAFTLSLLNCLRCVIVCLISSQDENGTISKVRGTHFKGVAIVDTTTEEGKRRVESYLGKVYDAALVNSAVDVLNLMVRRSSSCRKPSTYRVQAKTQEDLPGSRSSGPFVSSNTAYLSLITPSEMASLETGSVTVIERPYSPHWVERVNAAAGGNGTPRYASVMTMTQGAPSEKAKKYACKRCLVVGQKLQFTLDPTDTCEAPEEHDSPGNQTAPTDSEPICENVATTISSMHCCLESILCRTEGMSTEELATLKGILGDIKSLVVPRPCPTPERTDPSGWDAVREVKQMFPCNRFS